MANVRASSRSSTGSQRLFGKASLVGNTVRAKIGGRVTALAIPTSEAAKLERAGQDATAHRKLQAAPEYALELEHVYGYTENCQNVISTGRGYCYTASSLGVLWDEESQNQRFLQGHTAEVTAIAYSSSTQLIATGQKFVGNKSSGIRVWSVDQPGPVKEKCQILGHNQSVYSLAFSADGRWLFSMAAEERARSKGSKQSSGRSNELTATTSPLCAWKLDDAKLKAGLQPRASHLRLAMKEKVKLVPHPEESNRLLAFGGRAAYFITCDWAAKDVSQRATWNSPSPPDAMAGLAFYGFSAGCFIPGEDNLAVLAVPGGVFVIDALESGPVCRYGLPLENLEVRFLLPLPSGHLLCGGSGGCLSLLESDLSSAEVVKIAGVSSTDFAAATVTTGTAQATETMVVAGAMNGSLLKLRLDIETRQCSGELLQQSPSGMAEVRALAVNPSAPKNLAVADSSGVVFFYDLEKRKMVSLGGPFPGAISSMAWHPLGQFLVLGLEAGNLHGLILEGGNITEQEIKHLLSDPSEVTALQFSPAGNWLAVGHRDGQVQVLAVPSSSLSPTYSPIQYRLLPGNASAIMALQFTKDGTSVASNARDGAVLCWEVETGKVVVSNFPAETWFGDGHRFGLTISWAMWGAWSRDSYRSSAAVLGESHGTLRVLATGDVDGLVRLQRFPVPVPDALSKDFYAHTSRVADLAWAGADRLVTAGMASCALIQWRLISQRRSDAQPKDSARAGPSPKATASPRQPQSPKNVSASMRSTGSTDAAPTSRVSNTSTATATARSKSPAKPAGRPKARVSSPQRSPSPRGAGAGARGRTPTRSARSSQGSSSMDPAKVRIAAKLAQPAARSRFKEVSVQTDSLVAPAPGVYLAAPPAYAGRFIAVDRTVPWQVCSRHASPVRVISPPRLVSAPAAVSRIAEPIRLNLEGPLLPPSPRVLLSPALGYRAPTPGAGPTQPAQIQVPSRSPPRSPAFTPPVPLRLTEPVSQISSPAPDRRIISIPSTPCGGVRSITPVPCYVTPKVADRPADLMLRIVAGNDHSSVIAVADVYLHRPPFSLEKAVAYGTSADGIMQELFSMPPGWGVLRAGGSTLLWLSLKQECGGQPSARRDLSGVALQLVIPAGKDLDGGNVPPVASGTGKWAVASSTARPLAAQEGMLRMGVGELHLSLESKMDEILKTWLGIVQDRGTTSSTSLSL